MRICVVSEDLSLPLDEGLKKFVISLLPPLSAQADVCTLSVRAEGPVPSPVQAMSVNRLFVSPRLRRVIRTFRPHVILYVPRAAATRNSFYRLTVLRSFAPRARSIMVSLQPRLYDRLGATIVRLLHPDLLLTQSIVSLNDFQAHGCPSALLPSGVDLHSFYPVTPEERAALRVKYGLSPTGFVVVHVGHLEQNRNVLVLNRLRAELDCQTVMVASTWLTYQDRSVVDAMRSTLIAGGTMVIDRYLERVAEAYQLADCYLFPTHDSGSAIDMPLSVLEALACGIPVVSTRFGQLPWWFREGPGYAFARTDDDLVAAVRQFRFQNSPPDSNSIRALAAPFTWEAIAQWILSLAGQSRISAGMHFEPAAADEVG